ncbi:MAG: hypothetical protein PUE33_03020 [bacterium]|nr:hypothetical protein [Mycoplasmatota bacterium]MDD6757023.1 hypothetical protein [bacterium]MDY2907570.1 hypothetical protein [Candidatus Faecimonas sp.]
MNIDLTALHSHVVDKVDITNIYTIPEDYFGTTGVKKLEDIKVDGYVYLSPSEDDIEEEVDSINCKIEGNMIIEDSISLEPVQYPFSINYDDIIEENCKKNENTLDIFSFLWENIVLEVPLQFTKVEDFSKFRGDGWKLVSENELTENNNPFSELLDKMKEE